MISGLLFLNSKGDVLISRYYRDNISRQTIDTFRQTIIQQKTMFNISTNPSPIVHIDDTSFIYMKEHDLYIVAVTAYNVNVALVLQYMYKLLEVFTAYFQCKQLDENIIRRNFILIYELFDECCDYGWPQITSIPILQSYIQMTDLKDVLTGAERYDSIKKGTIDSGITSEITGHVDWRQVGKYKYRKNELFIDVLESVNLLMSTKGSILRADVSGKIIMKTYLTGMPEAKLGLNDKLMIENEIAKKQSNNTGGGAAGGRRSIGGNTTSNSNGIAIDDVTFHRCVKLGQFDIDRTISFIPPDGEFELMSYRITDHVNLPFRVTPIITEYGRNRVEYDINLKTIFGSKLFATNIIVKIPTPVNVSRVTIQPSLGKAKYNATLKCLVWKVKKSK